MATAACRNPVQHTLHALLLLHAPLCMADSMQPASCCHFVSQHGPGLQDHMHLVTLKYHHNDKPTCTRLPVGATPGSIQSMCTSSVKAMLNSPTTKEAPVWRCLGVIFMSAGILRMKWLL